MLIRLECNLSNGEKILVLKCQLNYLKFVKYYYNKICNYEIKSKRSRKPEKSVLNEWLS